MAGKNEIVSAVFERHGEITKKQAGEVFDLIIDCMSDSLAEGDSVKLPGFGTFLVAERAEREGRNPQTKKPMIIPASRVVRFRVGKALKDAVNK